MRIGSARDGKVTAFIPDPTSVGETFAMVDGKAVMKKADGSVDIVNMGAAGTPLTTGDTALLGVDVWEHAYYIDYRNLRPKFVETFLDNLVNWEFAEKNFA